MIYILDRINGELVKSEIVPIDKKTVPLKKDGWNFNWLQLSKEENGRTYVLRTLNSPELIEGALQLKLKDEMLIMDALELAPHNIGQKKKRYDYVAGCLISLIE